MVKRNRGKQPKAAPTGVAASYAAPQLSGEPHITQKSNGTGCRVVHSELVTNMVGGAGFNGVSLEVNPGLASVFPFLSTIAAGFQLYRFHKLEFRYVTRQGTTADGNVIMAPDYESSDEPPLSEVLLSSLAGAAEAAVWASFPVQCKVASMFAQGAKKLIRTTPILADLERQLYDACTIHVFGQDTPAAELGKVWVDYDIEFYAVGIPARMTAGDLKELSIVVKDFDVYHAYNDTWGQPSLQGLEPAHQATVVDGGALVSSGVWSDWLTLPTVPGPVLPFPEGQIWVELKPGWYSIDLDYVAGLVLGGSGLGQFNMGPVMTAVPLSTGVAVGVPLGIATSLSLTGVINDAVEQYGRYTFSFSLTEPTLLSFATAWYDNGSTAGTLAYYDTPIARFRQITTDPHAGAFAAPVAAATGLTHHREDVPAPKMPSWYPGPPPPRERVEHLLTPYEFMQLPGAKRFGQWYPGMPKPPDANSGAEDGKPKEMPESASSPAVSA